MASSSANSFTLLALPLAGANPSGSLHVTARGNRKSMIVDDDDDRRTYAYVRDPAGLTWSFDMAAALGTPRFKKAVARSLERGGENRLIPVECRRCAQPSLERVFSAEEADGRSRDALILVAHVTHGYRLAEIARFLAVAPSTVSKALSPGPRTAAAGACGGLAVTAEEGPRRDNVHDSLPDTSDYDYDYTSENCDSSQMRMRNGTSVIATTAPMHPKTTQ